MSIINLIKETKLNFQAERNRRSSSARRSAEEELILVKAKRAIVEEDTKVFQELAAEKEKLKIAEANKPKTGIIGAISTIKKKKAEFREKNPNFGKARGVFAGNNNGNNGGGFF